MRLRVLEVAGRVEEEFKGVSVTPFITTKDDEEVMRVFRERCEGRPLA